MHRYSEKLEAIKREICRAIEYEMAETQLTQTQLAKQLNTSQANLSRLANKHVEQLSFDLLFRYLAVLRPNFKVLVAPH